MALNIILVYGVSYFVDRVILNSIEFWTGSNPMEAGEIKKIESENGTYTVETLENGYNIQNEEGQSMNFIYDQTTNTWNAEANGESVKLIQIEDENNAIVYLPNGVEQRVELSNNGMLAFRQTVQSSYLALR